MTATCNLYADLVKFSLEPAVEPCHDYYHHVCGGWLRRRRDTVLEDVLRTFAERATQLVRRLSMPAHFQTPQERAARAYMACVDVQSKFKEEDDDVKSALQLAGLFWPRRGATANPLFTLLSLTRNWGLAFLIRLHKERKRRYVIQPTDRYRDLVQIWQKAYEQALHESLFNELRARYNRPGAAVVPYGMQASLENKTLLALQEPFWDADAPDLELDGSTVWHSLVEQNAANVSRDAWRAALAELFAIGPDSDVQMVIRRPDFVRQVFHLPSLLGDEGFALSVGWMMVQILSFVANQEVVVRVLSGGYRQDAKAAQLAACFDLVQMTMGFALNAEYVKQAATRATLDDVAIIVRRVSQNIREKIRLSPDFGDVKVPSYDNQTGAVFRYLEKSTDTHLGSEFSAFTDMSPVLLKSLHTLSRGFTQVMPEDVSPWPYAVKMTAEAKKVTPLLARVYREELDFALMPYALAFPVYEPGAPLSVKYGALGSVVGTSLAELFFANGSWTGAAEERLQREVTCFLSYKTNASSLSLLEWELMFRLTSVQATWRAYRVAQADGDLEYIENLPDIRGDRLFFFAWCYLKCGDTFGKDACNGPLSHSLAFAEAYNCTSGAPMKQEWRCGMLDNAD
ncbi:neprilysin-1-like [Dermacentor andersoni]|uniref:neprilysin-1-like n=1 Tax=Dermacentor andersoni TaxID=34620 RepID=UPI0021554ED0|nr:neprilysin-1-like [Dermacentor andersoni]